MSVTKIKINTDQKPPALTKTKSKSNLYCLTHFKQIPAQKIDKYKLISLHIRLTTNPEQRTKEIQELLSKTHQKLTHLGQKTIPFLTKDISLEKSLAPTLAKNSTYKEKLGKTIEQWKKSSWNVEKRKRFIKRTNSAGLKENVTKDTVKVHQENELVPKYEKEICFDSTTGEFMYLETMDLDHTDPWSNIIDNVQQCITDINNLNIHFRAIIGQEITQKYPGYFIYNDDTLTATQYLGMSLFNYDQNLTTMKTDENNSKGNKNVIKWIEEKYPNLSKHICKNPLTTLASIIDTTGFITAIINDKDLVKDEFAGKGLGKAIYLYALADLENVELRKEAFIEYIKNIRLIQCSEKLKQILGLLEDEVTELESLEKDFIKHIKIDGTKHRNEFRTGIETALDSHPSDPCLVKSDEEVSPRAHSPQ
ncbi:hypothetical protein DID76_04465 [Candidatus Marinamargulisbacteria bacterium SCGC AG-414-C22]|nr:hypothetical protein DID76_04465 [Candidatus Marinamargulisbacteria bacterium SCGC AG-414-C22]